MQIIKTSYGNEIIIPKRKWNSEFTYQVRRVKVLNKNLKQHPAIEKLSQKEARIYRKLVLLVFSMDNFFKQVEQIQRTKGSKEASQLFDAWEKHNRMDWNEYFHDNLRMLEEEVNSFSFTYADIARVCGYSYCL